MMVNVLKIVYMYVIVIILTVYATYCLPFSFNFLTSVDVFRHQNVRQNFFDKLVLKVL